jgi:NAD(P) transhydrogenase subunit alpha
MRIAVPRETAPSERRVALAPDAVAKLTKAGIEVIVECGAGAAASYSDEAYACAGAMIAPDAATVYAGADLVAKVQPPSDDEIARMRSGATLISLMQPDGNGARTAQLAKQGVTALALERVPRITRAQSMDVLSSQATVAGYRAVLIGAEMLPKFLPMLTTAAGTIAPAKTFVIGAGVAGLQAIATARRLGAIVSAFDIRPAAREQVQSLGASFVAVPDVVSQSAETAGGYAKEQGEAERERTLAAIGNHVKEMDLVITTAQIPGRPAPRLITAAMIATMKPGSVIIDLASESGGNVELSRTGETVVSDNGVRILGPLNLVSGLPVHASQMLSRNVHTLLQHLIKDGKLAIDLNDEITGAMTIAHGGEVRAG